MSEVNQKPKRTGRKRLLLAAGAGVGVVALVTAAAFTDFANLNLGTDGLGAAQYNIQVVGTDPVTGIPAPGTWQEANTVAGAPIAITGADTLFPGGPPVTVTIPVQNASTTLSSSLEVALLKLPDAAPKVTDANYLASLRFSISQPATAIDATPVALTDLTYTAASAVLNLNDLEALEVSSVTISVSLLDQATSGAAYADNTLNGKKAYVQADFTGSSIS